jgi:F0F1-type ATP synthase membrane subunit b/b'
MSNDFIAAAESIKTIANRFKGIVDLAETMERIGSVVQAGQEADTALANARDRRDAYFLAFESEKSECEAQLKKTREQAAKMLDNAKTKAAELEAQAIASSEQKAKAIVDSATLRADNELNAATNKILTATARANQIDLGISEKIAQHEQLCKTIGELKADHAALVTAFADLKMKFA